MHKQCYTGFPEGRANPFRDTYLIETQFFFMIFHNFLALLPCICNTVAHKVLVAIDMFSIPLDGQGNHNRTSLHNIVMLFFS